jgi:hypothetical protein
MKAAAGRKGLPDREDHQVNHHEQDPDKYEPYEVMRAVATVGSQLPAPDRDAVMGHVGAANVPPNKTGDRTDNDR